MYLWHWPLQVWTGRVRLVGPEPLGHTGAGLRAHVTIGLAALSYHLIEVPIRYGRMTRLLVPRGTFAVVALTLTAVFAINTNVVLPHAGRLSAG